MLKLLLIRHSLTMGNTKRRYIGVTDEPLCEEGRALLADICYPQAELLFSSPLRRCIETAQLLYPGQPIRVIDALSECDFGEFENKNCLELAENSSYRAWVDSGCTLPIPGGEDREAFKKRSIEGFAQAVRCCFAKNAASAAFVVHGGTIMNLMEAFAMPEKPFYDWHLGNARAYALTLDLERWQNGERALTLLP